MHCSLEAVGIVFAECCNEASAGHDAADTDTHSGDCEICAQVESGGYAKPAPQLDLKPLLAAVALIKLELETPVASSEHSSLRVFPSPDAPPSWRFIERAALPPRAPTFVS